MLEICLDGPVNPGNDWPVAEYRGVDLTSTQRDEEDRESGLFADGDAAVDGCQH